MSSPAVSAKYVAALAVAVVGAGTFVGVSHDGRGAGGAVDTVPVVTSTVPAFAVTSTAPAAAASSASVPEPIVPEASPRLRVRSHGS